MELRSLAMVLLSLSSGCAVGVPAEPPPLTDPMAQQGVNGLVASPPGFGASGRGGSSAVRATAGRGSAAGSAGSVAAGSGGASAGRGPGATRGPECEKLTCSTILDCVFMHFGNKCAFTKCESGVCL
jgi:hypothetical protein